MARAVVAALFAFWLAPGLAAAQAPAAAKPVAAEAKPAAGEKVPPIPDPVDIVPPLVTPDGVEIQATFYGSNKGHDAIPFILVHGYKGNRGELKNLALLLQSKGCAVIVPDLRGHGGSTKLKTPIGMPEPKGKAARPLDVATFRMDQFRAMVDYDMEAMKAFLLDRNNKGELNINKLGVVGTEMGATIALAWAQKEYAWPPLTTGPQGQLLKAMVLISPEYNSHGLSIRGAITDEQVRTQISTLILVGAKKASALSDADKIFNGFNQFNQGQSKLSDADKAEKQKHFLKTLDTSLQGTKLLAATGLNVDKFIVELLRIRLENLKLPWKEHFIVPRYKL